MLAACSFGTLLFYSGYLQSRLFRPLGFVWCSWGRRWAALRSPSSSLRWGVDPVHTSIPWCPLRSSVWAECTGWMRLFYIVSQFVGGASWGTCCEASLGPQLASPSVRYVVTAPGHYGVAAAFLAEFFMGLLTMTVVLQSGNRPGFALHLVAGWTVGNDCM